MALGAGNIGCKKIRINNTAVVGNAYVATDNLSNATAISANVVITQSNALV